MIDREIENAINDFKELGFPELVFRDSELLQAKETVSTIIGARRVGKSYRAIQAAQGMIEEKRIPSIEHICPVDFDNPHFSNLRATDLSVIERTFLKMNPAFSRKSPILFILDEIHKIPGWEEYVVALSRNPHWNVIVTGSSSRMLRENIATELRGKSLSSVIYPLTFREFLRFRGVASIKFSTVEQARMERLFDEFIQWGAYPAVALADERIKEHLLREYFDVMILRDIIQRYEVSQPKACTALLRHLLSNISKPFTRQSCFEYVTASGFRVGKESVLDWIEWAQDAWLLFAVPIFSASSKAQERNYRKAYCIDWALANTNSFVWDGGYSRALENMVYLHLLQRWHRVQYYLTRSDRKEIDFVCIDNRGAIRNLVQVCLDMVDPQTEKRELEALVSASRYFGCRDCVIVTRSEDRLVKDGELSIRIVPVWRWLLEE